MPDHNQGPRRTNIARAAEGRFEAGLRAFFDYRTLEIDRASGGAFGANVIRAIPGAHATGQWHSHGVTFQMVYLLKGWVRFEYEDLDGEVLLQPGDCVYQAPGVKHREIAHSDDMELIEITAPAEFETLLVDAPAGRG